MIKKMKTASKGRLKLKKIFALVIALIVCASFLNMKGISHTVLRGPSYNDLIGTWYFAEDTSLYKLVFTANNKCNQYQQGQLSETDTVIVSTSSPQCGIVVPVDKFSTYIQLKDLKDSSAVCYLINNLTSNNLSISVVDQAKRSDFIKY